MGYRKYISFVCGVLLAIICQGCKRTPSIDLQDVLKWIPADTETLIVANGPFWISNFIVSGDPRLNREISQEDLEKEFRRAILPDFRFLSKCLDRQRVLFAAEGSRHFRSPQWIGLMPYEGCQIAVFAADQGGRFSRFTHELNTHGASLEKIEQEKVVVIQERSNEDIWTFFIANPLKNVVLVATNREYMQEVLVRMHGRIEKTALPETLPEWRYVNRKAQFWGLRHYAKGDTEDPSSPFGGDHAANIPDEQAIGVTFECTPKKQKSAEMTYLSDNPDILRSKVFGNFPESEPAIKDLGIQCRRVDRNVVKGSFILDHSEPVSYFLFGMMGSFGHAVFP